MSQSNRIIVVLAVSWVIQSFAIGDDRNKITTLRGSSEDRPIASKAQEDFAKTLDDLRVKFEVHFAALERLEKQDNGTPEAAMRINLMRTILLGDQMNLIAKAQPAATRLEYRIEQDVARRQALIEDGRIKIAVVQRAINELADRIVKAESEPNAKLNDDSTIDPEEEPDEAIREATISGWKGQLAELVTQAEDNELAMKFHAAQIEQYGQEKRELKRWEAKLQAQEATWRSRAEGIAGWFANQTEGSLGNDIRQDQEAVRKVSELIRNLPVDKRKNGRPRPIEVGTPGLFTSGAVEPPAGPAPQSPRVALELESARKRRANGK
jgi:hypothetical protein